MNTTPRKKATCSITRRAGQAPESTRAPKRSRGLGRARGQSSGVAVGRRLSRKGAARVSAEYGRAPVPATSTDARRGPHRAQGPGVPATGSASHWERRHLAGNWVPRRPAGGMTLASLSRGSWIRLTRLAKSLELRDQKAEPRVARIGVRDIYHCFSTT